MKTRPFTHGQRAIVVLLWTVFGPMADAQVVAKSDKDHPRRGFVRNIVVVLGMLPILSAASFAASTPVTIN
jgi:hypothetical protein